MLSRLERLAQPPPAEGEEEQEQEEEEEEGDDGSPLSSEEEEEERGGGGGGAGITDGGGGGRRGRGRQRPLFPLPRGPAGADQRQSVRERAAVAAERIRGLLGDASLAAEVDAEMR